MAVTLELDNDELASLFFYMQLDERCLKDPLMEKLVQKMENLIFSRFSIDEIEHFRNRIAERHSGEGLR